MSRLPLRSQFQSSLKRTATSRLAIWMILRITSKRSKRSRLKNPQPLSSRKPLKCQSKNPPQSLSRRKYLKSQFMSQLLPKKKVTKIIRMGSSSRVSSKISEIKKRDYPRTRLLRLLSFWLSTRRMLLSKRSPSRLNRWSQKKWWSSRWKRDKSKKSRWKRSKWNRNKWSQLNPNRSHLLKKSLRKLTWVPSLGENMETERLLMQSRDTTIQEHDFIKFV